MARTFFRFEVRTMPESQEPRPQPGPPRTWRATPTILLASTVVATVVPAPLLARQRVIEVDAESTVSMPKPVRLGRSKSGYSVWLELSKASAGDTVLFFLSLSAGSSGSTEVGPSFLLMRRVEIEADGEKLELEILPQGRAGERQMLQQAAAMQAQQPGAGGAFRIEEQKHFPITAEELLSLAAADEVTIHVFGSSGRESEHAVRRKHLDRLRDWIDAHVE